MGRILPLSLLGLLALATACNSKREPAERNQIITGDLVFTPANQHKKVSAEIDRVDFVFEVENRGTEPISILDLDADCACIEESITQPIIQPGESSSITATYITDKVSGITDKILEVNTDQANAGKARLNIKLEVEPIYQFSEKRLTWRVNQTNTAQIIDFRVTREKPIRLLAAHPSRPEFKTSIQKIVDGKHYRIQVQPTTTERFMIGFIRLETDCEVESLSRPLLYTTVQE